MGNKSANNMVKGKKKKLRFSLVMKVVFFAVSPLLVMAVVLTVVGVNSIKSGMQSEVMDRLMSSVAHLEGVVNVVGDGDFSLEDDDLIKGSYNLTHNSDMLDSLVKGTDIDVTLFYGKTRRATTLIDHKTNQRILGTDASDEVYNKVVKNGETLSAYDLVINDEEYYAFYKPMKNTDGTIVGMYFAGAPATDMNAFINKKIVALVVCAVIIALLSVVLISYFAILMRKAIHEADDAVTALAGGDLHVSISEKELNRNDELGDMARGVKTLQNELLQILSKVKNSSEVLMKSGKDLSTMASQTSSTADEIGRAVEDISKGAVSQAEEIESASERIADMGDVISRIVDSVETLDQTSADMKHAGDQSTVIIHDLSLSNDKTMEAIAKIGKQVNATNESANKISEAVEIITNIAEETNLLALNASIEAARAGEQGKGFAVVANQIQKLAEQSNESTTKISEIIESLLSDSEHTVEVMAEVQKIVDEQQEKLQQTKTQFDDVSNGIDLSKEETDGIKGQTIQCDSARSEVIDIITNLSAISEENAASTQQTTASMQELNTTINLLAEAAGHLTKLSEELDEGIKFFRL